MQRPDAKHRVMNTTAVNGDKYSTCTCTVYGSMITIMMCVDMGVGNGHVFVGSWKGGFLLYSTVQIGRQSHIALHIRGSSILYQYV
jgi:hypothetical protein